MTPEVPECPFLEQCEKDREQVIEQGLQIARLEERLHVEATARGIALSALETWKAGANEWRQTVVDIMNRCVQREVYDADRKADQVRFTNLEGQHRQDMGRGGTLHATWLAFGVIFSMVLGAVALIIDLVRG